MHELAPCLVVGADGREAVGFVESCRSGLMRVRLDVGGRWLPVGGAIDVHVRDEVRGDIHYRAAVRVADHAGVELDDLAQLSCHQRRNAARVRVEVTCEACVDGADHPERVTVLDLSATGIRLLLHRELAVGTRLRMALSIGPTRTLSLVADVVRTEQSRTGWRYGCRFADLPEPVRDLLFEYVLLTQGQQRRASAAR